MKAKKDNAAAQADVTQEGAVDVGNAAAGKVCRAFEDAGNGRSIERGGDENGGVREGELVEVRWR